MKALRYLGPGHLAVQEVRAPTISENEVLVKVMAIAVAHGAVKKVGSLRNKTVRLVPF